MNIIRIKKRLNISKTRSLMSLVCFLASEVVFVTIHDYSLDEDLANDLLNEFRQSLKESHQALKNLLLTKDQEFLKLMRYKGYKDEDSIMAYLDDKYQKELECSHLVSENLDNLCKETKTRDYKELFPNYSKQFVKYEVHMYTNNEVSTIPMDLVGFKVSDNVKTRLESFISIKDIFALSANREVALKDFVFYEKDHAFCFVDTTSQMVYLELDDINYAAFKKLNIKHALEIR